MIEGQLSGARKYYRNRFSLRWETLDADRVAKLERSVAPDRWYAVLFPYEVDEMKKRAPGEWTQLSEYRGVTVWHRTR